MFVESALKEIDEKTYLKNLEDLTNKKWDRVKDKDIFKKKHKTYNFLLQKGYESYLIWQFINKKDA